MAGFFPLAYSTVQDLGATNANENQYFYIHNAANLSIYSDAAFDVYTFAEDPGESDTRMQAYALVIIKNMGAAASHLEISEITLGQGTLDSMPFTFMREINNYQTTDSDVKSSLVILTPTEFGNLNSGTNNVLPNGLDISDDGAHGPWGYLRVEEQPGNTVEAEVDEDGNQTTDFDGSAYLYIPLYDPANTEFQAGLICHGEDSRKIGAKTINNFTYPEYGAFLIKCNPVGELDGVGELTITFDNPTGASFTFDLPLVAYRRGSLAYQQGYWQKTTGSFDTTMEHGATVDKVFNTEQVDYAPQTNGTASGSNFYTNFPLNSNTTDGIENCPAYVEDASPIANHILHPMMPFGYPADATGHLSNPISGVDYSEIYIKAYDETTFTGGVRVLRGLPTFLIDSVENTNSNKHVFNSSANTISLSYYTTPPTDENTDGEEVSSELFKRKRLEEEDVIYARLRRQTNHERYLFSSANDACRFLHPNLDNQLSGEFTGHYNRRTEVSMLPFFHNPFFITEFHAEDGENDEVVDRDTLYSVLGDYDIFTTNALTVSKYSRIESIANLNNTVSSNAFSANGAANDRFGDCYITENVAGLQTYPGTSLHKETNLSSISLVPDGDLSYTNGTLRVWKHKHIYDMFILPPAQGTNITLSGIEIQYNNISGFDGFYSSNFKYTTAAINSNENPFANAGETNTQTAQPVSLIEDNEDSLTNFAPGGIESLDGNTQLNPTQQITVFSKDDTTIPWNDLTTASLYPANAKKKTVNLKLDYTPEVKDFTETLKYNGGSGAALNPTDYNGQFLDGLGRIKNSCTLKIKALSADLCTGNGSTTKVFTGGSNMHERGLEFHFYGKALPPHWTGLSLESSLFGNSWTSASSGLFITDYVPEDEFGESTPGANNRVEYDSEHIVASSQSSGTDFVATANSTHGLGVDGIKAIRHDYAYGKGNESTDRYWLKYPKNGPVQYKYERYFAKNNFITSTAGSNVYGILPGPFAEGRFINGIPVHHNLNKSNIYLTGTAGTLNNGRYECVIPFNFSNQNHQDCHIVDISLENYVGDFTAGTFGDPRAINGGNLTIASNGDVGNTYQIPLSTAQFKHTYAAPYTSIQGTASDKPYASVSITNITATGATAQGGSDPSATTAGMVTGMKILQQDGNTDKIPSGTTITVVNGTTISFSQNVTQAAIDAGSLNVYLDYPTEDYVIWDLVKFDLAASQAAGYNVYVKDNDRTPIGNNNFLSTTDVNGDVGVKHYNNTYVAPGQSSSLSLLDKGKLPAMDVTNPQNGNASDGTFYGQIKANDETDGETLIYFAVNDQINQTNNPSPNTNNEITEGLYFNRLKIRYIVHEKLENYGVNQINITGDNIDTSAAGLAGQKTVFEDIYLVRIEYVNKTAEPMITDIEGNTNTGESVIDFGTLQSE